MGRKAKHLKKNDNLNKYKTTENKCLKILLIFFIAVFIISGVILLNWYINTSKSEEKYEELANEYVNENIDEDTEESAAVIDFEQLKNINSDIIAWIQIDETNINYPVVQTTDNSYYLTHSFEKSEDSSGALFLDYKNKLTDKNLVIYGHNIKKGTMFSELTNIYKGELGEDVEITLHTENETINFKVFSSYCTNPEDFSIDTSITEENLSNFAETLKQKSERNFTVDTSSINQILTLSTCDTTGKKRILVHAGS